MSETRKTTIDYLIIAVCPILIGLLVGSLAFFVLECTQAGRHDQRVRWIVTCFVVAIVGISRISIEIDRARAGAYGIALASVTFLAVTMFSPVPFPAMLVIVGLTWWASHKLTWNCTFIDEKEEDIGRGLLEPEEDEQSEKKERHGWAFVKSLFIESEDRRHAPGIWIIYFAVVAIPIFTLGQWMIPVSDAASRGNATRYVGIYLLSTLGLLVATSLLGLRRYLRRRGAAMPNDITAAWLVLGGVLILLCAWLAAFLPRPGMQESELLASVRRYLTERQPSHSASQFGTGNDAAEENPDDHTGSGRGGEDRPDGEKEDSGAEGGGSGKQGRGDGTQSRGGGSQGGEESAEDGKIENEDGGAESGGEQSGGGEQGKKGDGGSGSGGPKSGGSGESKSDGSDSSGKKSGDSDGKKSDDSRSDDSNSKTKPDRSPQERRPKKDSGNESDEKESQDDDQKESEDKPQEDSKQKRRGLIPPSTPKAPRPSLPAFTLGGVFGALAAILRWIVFIGLIVLVAYWAYRHRQELLQAIREILESLRALWASLWGFGGKKKEVEEVEKTQEAAAAPRKRFTDLVNPFSSGQAGRMDSRALVQATFEAVETWAADFGIERHEEETPRQFLGRLRNDDTLPPDALSLLNETYSRTTYDALEESAETKRVLESRLAGLWRAMSERAESAYSSASTT